MGDQFLKVSFYYLNFSSVAIHDDGDDNNSNNNYNSNTTEAAINGRRKRHGKMLHMRSNNKKICNKAILNCKYVQNIAKNTLNSGSSNSFAYDKAPVQPQERHHQQQQEQLKIPNYYNEMNSSLDNNNNNKSGIAN